MRWFLWLLAVITRLCLLLSPIRDQMSSRVEVSTPVTSFTRMKEGAYLWELGASPYSGDVLHQPPFILFLFYPFITLGTVWQAVLFTTLQVVCAYALMLLAKEYLSSEEARPSCSLRGKLCKYQVLDAENWSVDSDQEAHFRANMDDRQWLPHTVALIYLMHPYSMLSCVGMSTVVLDHLIIVLSLLSALRGQALLSTFLLSFAAYASPYLALLLPAIALLLARSPPRQAIAVTTAMFVVWGSVLIFASWLAMGDFDFISSVYGFVVFVPDLVPNVGLFWYFFMEVFDHFKSFFLFIFQYHIAVYTIPLAMRLGHRPLFLALCLISIISIFKSYPCIGDSVLCFALGPIFHRLFSGIRHMYHLFQVLLFVTVLAPIFWHLWIVTGSGNSNFYYALTIAFAVAQVLLLSESMLAVFRYDRAANNALRACAVERFEKCWYDKLVQAICCPSKI